ncbi:adenylate and guanylate cyclase catalytic domain protein [Stylonychia lemnae]|uniref:Adenylate and guanylate cyclase catalytic domain protein n=1 Tax=Stylonychia lemnae TaxID=5949 RepID=A0A078AQB9_STYLE|nr:adenylate and guanylate cyclase catalytic domain protein [Stylonychia lemnae]|eukprot:CDW84359.1 adenylate and guanylate cyclase catalytic domain protein [Stylonychia lemnae]
MSEASLRIQDQPEQQVNYSSATKLPNIDTTKKASEKQKFIEILNDQSPHLPIASPLLKDDENQNQLGHQQTQRLKTADGDRQGSQTLLVSEKKTVDNHEEEKKDEEKKKNPILVKVDKFMNGWIFQGVMTVVTIYSLFGDDVRQLAFTKDADDTFNYMTSVSLALFILELLLACIAKDDYWLGFYFWLDAVSTASLITDISWIMNQILGTGDGGASNAQQAAKLAKAGRGARIGTKAGRVARVIRLIRLIRIVKLYKTANNALAAIGDDPLEEELKRAKDLKDKQKLSQQQQNKVGADNQGQDIQHGPVSTEANKAHNTNSNHDDEKVKGKTVRVAPEKSKEPSVANFIPQESKVGKKLSDLTTRRVIVLVLAMLISVPVFSDDTYLDDNNSYDGAMQVLQVFSPGEEGFNLLFKSFIEQQVRLNQPLILANCKNITWESGIDPADLRDTEQQIAATGADLEYVAIYDIRYQVQVQSGLSIGNTFFVCIVLAGGALLFTSQCNDLVVNPIEQMIKKVTRISENPLLAAQEEENEALAMEKVKEEMMKQKKGGKKPKKKTEGPMETVVLEQTIVKIGALLALGFGEAGSKIIAQNMASGGEVNPMLPGQKIIAIFGFCDIRNFTDATEVLQEGVMLFVNEIGEIVHGVVDQFSGAANKNIGDAFLLAWKIPDEDVDRDEENDTVELIKTNRTRQLCDMSVLSFLKIISAIKKSRKLVKYKEHAGLNLRMPNYSVKMGFGLHVGWAIEGAIGSFYKIDASYLSPNVNMASRLEAATKQFGVPLLISGELVGAMTPFAAEKMRMIDRVTVKGSIEPLGKFQSHSTILDLYTCDVNFDDLPLDPYEHKISRKEAKLRRVKARIARDRYRQLAFDGQIQVAVKFETDKDLIEMRKMYSDVSYNPIQEFANLLQTFFEVFRQAFVEYIKGNWKAARDIFETVEEHKKAIDYPTRNLLAILEEAHFQPPSDWEGYRILTEK